MSSPFPGIDPWLEQHWGDVHTSIATYCRDAIQDQLPGDLHARVEETVRLEWEGDDGNFRSRSIVPDVMVVERTSGVEVEPRSGGVATIDEPVVVEYLGEPQVERYIEICDLSNEGRLITVIEVISKTNKSPGIGLDLHLKKREQLTDAGIHLVEIDLLRDGQRELAFPPKVLRSAYESPGVVVVTRQQEFAPRYEVYPCTFDRRLPTFRIPLRSTDKDVILPLQAVYDQAYDRGRYRNINYNHPPEPPLTPVELPVIQKILQDQGRLTSS